MTRLPHPHQAQTQSSLLLTAINQELPGWISGPKQVANVDNLQFAEEDRTTYRLTLHQVHQVHQVHQLHQLHQRQVGLLVCRHAE